MYYIVYMLLILYTYVYIYIYIYIYIHFHNKYIPENLFNLKKYVFIIENISNYNYTLIKLELLIYNNVYKNILFILYQYKIIM